MKKQDLFRKIKNNKKAHSAKECAYLAVFVALVITAQVIFSVVPGVELVTVLFVSYSFIMGRRQGVASAVVFSLLRQIIFGIYPKILVLYLIYFPLLALSFGGLGKILKPKKDLVVIVIIACVCTIAFTIFDNILTPFWLGYTVRDARLYFLASLPFMFPQVVCTAVSVAVLFIPLCKVFTMINNYKLFNS